LAGGGSRDQAPTAAAFERYVRANLLIVGEEDNGHGLLLATLLSAAIQRSPGDVSFTITEFARPCYAGAHSGTP
jgi:hypothetical protein